MNIFQALQRGVYRLGNLFKTRQQVFGDIYKTGGFGGRRESASGPGSDLDQTEIIRNEIPRILKKFNIQVMIDAPCGDFHWMRLVDLGTTHYIGIDIVPEVVQRNREEFGKEFFAMDIATAPLPPSDLVLCRDCLVHLSFKDGLAVVRNFKKSSKYLLATTFADVPQNRDIITGDWRPLNLQLPPFSFPKPLCLINENCTEDAGAHRDKSLGLWDLTQIEF